MSFLLFVFALFWMDHFDTAARRGPFALAAWTVTQIVLIGAAFVWDHGWPQ